MAAPSVTVLAGAGSTTNSSSYNTASVTATIGTLVLIWIVHGRGGGSIPGDATSVAGVSIAGAVKCRTVTFDTLATPISKSELWAAVGTGVAGAITFTFPQQQSGCIWSIQRVNGANTSVETLGIRQLATNRGDAGSTFSTTLASFGDAQNFAAQMAGHSEATSTPEATWTELTDVGISSPTLRLASSWRDANDTSPTITLDSGAASSWPDATTSGLLVATTRTEAGAGITDTSWFTSRAWVTGAGTQASPYTVDRVLFTSQVNIGDWVSNNLAGKYVKFTNCRFREDGGDPTPGGSAGIWVRMLGPAMVIVEDSTIAPNQNPLPGGGTTEGTDKGFYSYVPFRLTRCNVYGSNVCVGFETERTEATSTIEDCYLHDIWSSGSDHTDIINGNFHASNLVVDHNMMDGIRVGGQYVTNGFGIYDDPTSSAAGIIENWTINNNYITRCNWQLLATTSTSRFLSPFVVTNNVWTSLFQSGRFNARVPSSQSGNVDENGNPLTF